MITYNRLLRVLISTIGLPFALMSYITTLIFGIIGIIPLIGAILSIIFELCFAAIFIWPLMALSWVFLKVGFLRPIVGMVGIIYSFLAYAVAVMLPSFG